MNTNRFQQFVNRSQNAVTRFRHGGSDYEVTMNLLTEHAHRVRRLNHRVAGGTAAQATALNDIYALMEQVQALEPATFRPDVGELMEPIGNNCYVTRVANVDY
jgi:hypothetical protein